MTTEDEHDQDQAPGTAPPALGQVFSQKAAAEACGTTVTTIRRWRQAGKTPGAYQVASGAWMYPLADLLAAGATVNPPSPPDSPPAGGVGAGSASAGEGEEAAALRAELARVRGELAEARHAAELAGQEAGHLKARLSERADHIRDLQQALAALAAAPERAALTGPAAAPPAVPEQQSAPAGEESGEGERRPWWRVGRR